MESRHTVTALHLCWGKMDSVLNYAEKMVTAVVPSRSLRVFLVMADLLEMAEPSVMVVQRLAVQILTQQGMAGHWSVLGITLDALVTAHLGQTVPEP